MTSPSETSIATTAAALYALLPAHLRHVDQTVGGGALAGMLGVLGLASAEIDAELQTWYDALFVETAGERGLVALAGLVAAPVLHHGAGRALVANTIRYHRGKGTARVLEAMAADVSGLPAVAVEYHQRLARCAHLLDVRPERPATANLTPAGTRAAAGSAFDLLPRLLDVRRARRHSLGTAGVHLLRPIPVGFAAPADPTVPEADLAGVPRCRPWGSHQGYFQAAQQPGAPLRLLNPDRRAEAAGRRPGETDLPDRLRRLPLHQETAELRAAAAEGRPPRLPAGRWFGGPAEAFTVFLRRGAEKTFRRVPPAEIRIVNLEEPPKPAGARPAATVTHVWYEPGPAQATRRTATPTIACAVDPVTGRVLLPPVPGGGVEVTEVRLAATTGIGLPIGAGAQDRNTPEQLFDVRRAGGDLVWIVDPVAPAGGSAETTGRTVATLADALAEVATAGAGRRSLVVLARCDLEGAPATLEVTVPPASDVHLVAAQWRAPHTAPGLVADPELRGYLVRRERRFTVDAPVRVVRGAGKPADPAGRLLLDGLELTRGLRLGARSVTSLDLRYVTVRGPGAEALTVEDPLVAARITIDRSICGALRTGTMTGDLSVTRSVVTADGAAGDALAVPDADVVLRDVTVLGPSSMRSLSATNTLFTASVRVTRRQSGCVRYSYLPPKSAAPSQFRCQPALALSAAEEALSRPLTTAEADAVSLANAPVLLDSSPDEPTFAMLHPLCPDSVRSGGEGDAEMGAFAEAAYGTAVADVRSLFDEYLPVALEAGVIDDTRSGAVAARRNRP